MAKNKIQFQEGLSLPRFLATYGTEEQCQQVLFKMRWPQGFRCPKCGHEHCYALQSRKLYQCRRCRFQASLTQGTIFASTKHMDGSVMVMLANWAQYIVTLQPQLAAESIAPVALVYKLHVFLGLTLFVLFPFTRLVHSVSAPVWYLGRRYQIVRQK